MDAKAWYLGPLGDLRALMCPDEGVKRPVQRYGGVHQALSGARTVDVTGHKASVELTLPWLTPQQSRFVEALHYRTVPGPFYLLDPLAANRLDRRAARLDPDALSATSGWLAHKPGAPSDVGVPLRQLEWSNANAADVLTVGTVPALPGESVVFSLWGAASTARDVELRVTELDASGTELATTSTLAALGAPWGRYELPVALSDSAASVRAAVAATAAGTVSFAAAQLESGDTATVWDLGGGALTVLVDQLERVSPNYPRNDVTVTLLEA